MHLIMGFRALIVFFFWKRVQQGVRFWKWSPKVFQIQDIRDPLWFRTRPGSVASHTDTVSIVK